MIEDVLTYLGQGVEALAVLLVCYYLVSVVLGLIWPEYRG